ncbi:MAG: hypothetical protein ACHREM_28775, partial [Polyangiales bacterium]
PLTAPVAPSAARGSFYGKCFIAAGMDVRDLPSGKLAVRCPSLTAYRGQNTRLTRYVALREFFPGKYAKGVAHRWDETAPEAVLDDDRALLVVGQDTEAWDRRASIDLARVVFVD